MLYLGGALLTSLNKVQTYTFCRNCSLCHCVTLVTLKVERAVQASLCHGLERIGEFLRLKCSDFNPVSKPSTNWQAPTRQTVSPKITQKGLSYSEKDTCKTLSRDDHAVAAAAALVEALIGQVGIWETGVKSKPQWSFLPWRESDLITLSRRASFSVPAYRPHLAEFLHQSQSATSDSLAPCIFINKISVWVDFRSYGTQRGWIGARITCWRPCPLILITTAAGERKRGQEEQREEKNCLCGSTSSPIPLNGPHRIKEILTILG